MPKQKGPTKKQRRMKMLLEHGCVHPDCKEEPAVTVNGAPVCQTHVDVALRYSWEHRVDAIEGSQNANEVMKMLLRRGGVDI